MNRLTVVLCGLMLAALPSTPALADTVYTYVGNPFTSGYSTPLPDGPYTTSDFVTVSFTVSTPLASNLFYNLTPTVFTFTDGAGMVDNTTATYLLLEINTDGSGNPISWIIQAQTSGSGHDIETVNEASFIRDFAAINGQNGLVLDDPGTWTSESTDPTPATTPEPASLFLLGTGALGLVGSIRRKLLG